mmetsp:Transcript_103045/g.327573  ORF Transcript_103045/g.327573 Transcript_103045/m.327573 type:complete len:390 (-) Transcript_103045:1033-2202(-)
MRRRSRAGLASAPQRFRTGQKVVCGPRSAAACTRSCWHQWRRECADRSISPEGSLRRTTRMPSPSATSWMSSWTAGRRRLTHWLGRRTRWMSAWRGVQSAGRSSVPRRTLRRPTRSSGRQPGRLRGERWMHSGRPCSAWWSSWRRRSLRRSLRGWLRSCQRSLPARFATSTSRAMPSSSNSLRPGGTAPGQPCSGARASGSGCCRRRDSSCAASSVASRPCGQPATATRPLRTSAPARWSLGWPWARLQCRDGPQRPCLSWRAPSLTSASACGRSVTVPLGVWWRRPNPSTADSARTRPFRSGRSGSWWAGKRVQAPYARRWTRPPSRAASHRLQRAPTPRKWRWFSCDVSTASWPCSASSVTPSTRRWRLEPAALVTLWQRSCGQPRA